MYITHLSPAGTLGYDPLDGELTLSLGRGLFMALAQLAAPALIRGASCLRPCYSPA